MAAVGLIVLGLCLVFDGATPSDSFSGFVIIVGVVVAYWLFGLRPRVELTDDAVIVQNPLRRSVLDLGSITEVRASYGGLIFDVRWHRAVTAWAVQKTILAGWVGRRTRADEIAERLRTVAQERQRDSS
jgi:hypothetical protein